MAASTRVAARYAKALLDLAKEKKAEDVLADDMKALVQLCENSRDFVVMLESPIVTHEKKQAILESIFSGKVGEIAMSFFTLLTKKNREEALPFIAEKYLDLHNEYKGRAIAEIQSAVPLTDALKKNITDTMSKAVDKDVQLKEIVNEDLIGGFILRLDDKQIDSSVSSQLSNLKNRLN